MKKLFLALLSSAMITGAYAQDGNNICVWNAINTYNTGGGARELERGIKCADEASVHESTANKSKTWFYRGQLFALIAMDKELKPKYANAGLDAAVAFKRLNEINDPKFREWEEVSKYLIPLATTVFNEGVEQYQAKNFASAHKLFYSIKDINGVLTAKGKKSPIDLVTSLKNAATCAENSGDVNAAMLVYKDWIAIAPDANAYKGWALALKRQEKKDEALKVVDEGLTKYPKDQNLIIEKLNFYLEEQKYVEGLSYLNNLLEIDPTNGEALFIKGLAYENDKIRNEDSSLFYYNKAIEVNQSVKPNPAHSKPYNNIGAMYVRKANDVNNEISKLGNTSADQKKYEELKKKQKDLFLQAKPFFEKALQLDPNDPLISRNLKQIELYTKD